MNRKQFFGAVAASLTIFGLGKTIAVQKQQPGPTGTEDLSPPIHFFETWGQPYLTPNGEQRCSYQVRVYLAGLVMWRVSFQKGGKFTNWQMANDNQKWQIGRLVRENGRKDYMISVNTTEHLDFLKKS